ncbi:hypothetical protein E2542_SST16338 [Spatholobus suberectus]|nr:hypothetical protein E2542_SST16338 [Spatholobus suberectus]
MCNLITVLREAADYSQGNPFPKTLLWLSLSEGNSFCFLAFNITKSLSAGMPCHPLIVGGLGGGSWLYCELRISASGV